MPPNNLLLRAIMPLRIAASRPRSSMTTIAFAGNVPKPTIKPRTNLIPAYQRANLSTEKTTTTTEEEEETRAAASAPEQEQQQQEEEEPNDNEEQEPSSSIPESKPKYNIADLPRIRKYPYTTRTGTVSSVGKMNRTVRVDHKHPVWDNYIKKTYTKTTTYLVADPNNSLREGDVIKFSSGYPKSRRVHHVVERIITAFGEPIEARPKILSREERDILRAEKRMDKLLRREEKKNAAAGGDGNIGDNDDNNVGRIAGHQHVGKIKSLVLERVAQSNGQVEA